MVIQTKFVRATIPAALLKRCQPKATTPVPTIGAVFDRLSYTEGALDACSAQVDRIIEWNAGH